MYVIDCASVDMMRMRQIFMTACVCGTRVDETYIVYALEDRACSDLFLLLQPRPRAFMIWCAVSYESQGIPGGASRLQRELYPFIIIGCIPYWPE